MGQPENEDAAEFHDLAVPPPAEEEDAEPEDPASVAAGLLIEHARRAAGTTLADASGNGSVTLVVGPAEPWISVAAKRWKEQARQGVRPRDGFRDLHWTDRGIYRRSDWVIWEPEAPRETGASKRVSPNKLHHMFLAEWKAAYPRTKLVASPGLRRRRKDLAFDADLTDAAEPDWAGEIDQVLFKGSFAMTEAVFFHRASRTAIFADLIQSLPGDLLKGWRRVLASLGGILEPNHGIPGDWQASFLGRNTARTALHRVLAWDIERIVIAHGASVQCDGNAFVRRASAWLADTGMDRTTKQG